MTTTKEHIAELTAEVDAAELENDRLQVLLESLGYNPDGTKINPKPVRRWLVHFRTGWQQEVDADHVEFGDMKCVTTFMKNGIVVAEVFSDADMILEVSKPEPELAMAMVGPEPETTIVDIRFRADVAEAVEALAHFSGVSPERWIEGLVVENVARR